MIDFSIKYLFCLEVSLECKICHFYRFKNNTIHLFRIISYLSFRCNILYFIVVVDITTSIVKL